MVRRVEMGKYDSSRTRVAPLFDALLERDVSGQSWLDALLQLGSRAEVVATLPVRQRLVANHGPRWGDSEAKLPAPISLLEYLVRNITPNMVESSRDRAEVRDRRLALASRDPPTLELALAELRCGKRGRQWFVLEGESRPDALLETTDLVLCVEGKRTEAACTTHTSWMLRRSQLLRHMDSALDAFPGKRVVGMLIVEGDGGAEARSPSPFWSSQCAAQYEQSMLNDSLPHRSSAERKRIADGVLGVTTWQALCSAVKLSWNSLPDVVSG
jgi:hypothetical protein